MADELDSKVNVAIEAADTEDSKVASKALGDLLQLQVRPAWFRTFLAS